MKKSTRNILIVTTGLFGFSSLSLWLISLGMSPLLLFGLLVLAGAGVLFGVSLVSYPKLAVYFLIAALVIGQIIRIRISEDASASLLPLDLALLGYFSLGFMTAALKRQPLPRSLAFIFLLAFLLWIPVGLITNLGYLSTSEFLVATAYYGRFIFLASVMFVTAWLAQKKVTQVWLLRLLAIAASLLLVLGIAQRILLPDISFLAQFGWDPHVNRLLSTFLDPNFFGMFLVMFYSVVLAGFLSIKGKAKTWLLVLGIILTLAILATLSRSSYLALAVATFVVLFFKSWRVMILAIIGAVLIVGAVPNVRERVIGAFAVDTTSLARIQSWQETLEVGSTSPIVGVGYNAYGAAKLRLGLLDDLISNSAQGGDSSLLLVYATTGLIGLLLYLGFWLALFLTSYAAWRTAKEWLWQSIALGLMAIIPAYLIHSNFVNGLFYPHLFVPFALLAGVLIGKLSEVKNSKVVL